MDLGCAMVPLIMLKVWARSEQLAVTPVIVKVRRLRMEFANKNQFFPTALQKLRSRSPLPKPHLLDMNDFSPEGLDSKGICTRFSG